MTKYEQLISRSKEQRDSALVGENVERAKLDLENTILNTKKQVRDHQAKLNSALGAFPTDWAQVIEAKRQAQMSEANLTDLVSLKEEFFSDVAAEA